MMLIVANWKAYVEDVVRAKKLFALSKKLSKAAGSTIVLAPPAPLLGHLAARNKSRVAFAAQDVSRTTGGARTGEATAPAYAAARATYAIIGHSERRAEGDADAIVAEKLSHAVAHGLTPILCVGERERDAKGQYLVFIREQLTTAMEALAPKDRSKVVVAYEPLWAIGKTAEAAIRASDLAEMVLYIRKVIAELLPGKNPRRVSVLYGGSGIDGFLIGHASVDPLMFSKLVKQLS